jgi:fucose 4-O-acetylase-like acetyltransferase
VVVDSSLRAAWSRASELAARTPKARNRYVDFLRAASILVVVIGHWLMAAPSVERGEFSLSDMLQIAPWTQWLTWVFQVMPLFFVVGGYANAASWEGARRSGGGYAWWIARRLRRLVRPVVPMVLAWCGIAIAAPHIGLSARSIEISSQVAFVPTWFLAVYVLVVVVAPATHAAWRRFGMASFWALATGAAAVDAAWLSIGHDPLSWANYAFVWLAVHQLGYAWHDGRLAGPARPLLCAAGGLAALALLVALAPYPVSMITVPGEEISNSSPPTLALLALGVFHVGLVLTLEVPAHRWLRRARIWTAIIFVNGAIMTLYLWHATVMILLVELAYLLAGAALALEPNSRMWWATRPLWILTLLAMLSPFVLLLGRFEASWRPSATVPATWRSLAGAVAVCAGLAALAISGIGAPASAFWRVLPTLAGALLLGAVQLPSRRSEPASR